MYSNFKIKTFLINVILLFNITLLHAQQNNVILSGYVSSNEEMEKLIGVNVYIKGTTTGTVTNENGYYELKLPYGNYTVVYSFIGCSPVVKEVELTGAKKLNVQLVPNEEILGEVQIIAQRRFFGNMDYGREIPTVKSAEIEKLNTSNASDILHARLAGVWATKTSGAPGDNQKIRIRGQASFFSSAEPLYVIDGVPVPIVNLASLGIADLNMNDIESVTVLKDASSTALYGYQGANGVILIDTKKTSENKLSFSYRSGFQWFNNYYDFLDTKDFIESTYTAKDKINSNFHRYYPTYSDSLADHNRQKEIFKLGLSNEVNLSSGGKIKSTDYYLSGSFLNQQGIIAGASFQRATITARCGRHFGNKLAVNLSYRGSYQNNKNNQNTYGGNRIIFEGINKSPLLESIPDSLIYNDYPDCRPYNLNNRLLAANSELNNIENFENLINENNVQLTTQNHAGSIMFRYQLNKHFSFNAIEAIMMRKSNYDSDMYYSSEIKSNYRGIYPIIFTSNEEVRLLNHQLNINYNRTWNSHTLNIVAAHRYYADNLWWKVDTIAHKMPEHYTLRNSMASYGENGSVVRKLTSYILHGSYNFREIYFLSAIANYSRLKEGLFIDYYTLFPSCSFSWSVSNEPFFPKTNTVSNLNLYASYGTSGNYPLNGLSNDICNNITFSDGKTLLNSNYISQLANHNLRHEYTTETSIGFKSSLINNRLTVNGAYFNKHIGNQIVNRNIPYYYGGGETFLNLGNIEVNGYEFSVHAIPVEKNDFNCLLNFNFSKSNQRVTKLADGNDMIFENDNIFFPTFKIKERETLGDIYGYKCLGEWDSKYENDINFVNIGNLAFCNADTTNKKIDRNDKVTIGNSLPDFTWNFSSTFNYKEFSLNMVFYSVWGVDKYNATRAGTIITGINSDILNYYNDSITAVTKQQFYESSAFIDNADFIRLKTISLTYSPKKTIAGMKCDFTISAENLFTFTKYKGYDPEATIYTDNNFSDNAIDKGAYPSPKSVFFKVNLKL